MFRRYRSATLLVCLGLLLVGGLFFYDVTPLFAQLTDNEIEKLIRTPDTKVGIPGLSFSEIDVSNGQLRVSTIGEYLGAIYRYGIAIVGLIAMIVLIISGIQWSTSLGNQTTIASAKKRIVTAVIGVALAVSSYTILYTINPELVLLRSLSLEVAQPIALEKVQIDTSPSRIQTSGGLKSSTYDELFKAFGNCTMPKNGEKLDWRFIKALAYKESAFINTAKTGPHLGLFQINPRWCNTMLADYPAWQAVCTADTNASKESVQRVFFDPGFNAAAFIGSTNTHASTVKRRCGTSLNPQLHAMLIYTGHNSGGGALSKVISNGGCESVEKAQQAVYNYWYALVKGDDAKKQKIGSTRRKSITQVGEFAVSLGMNKLHDASTNGSIACPMDGDPSAYKFSAPATSSGSGGGTTAGGSVNCTPALSSMKVVSIGDSITADARSYTRQLKGKCGLSVTMGVPGILLAEKNQQTRTMRSRFFQAIDDGKLDLKKFTHLTIMGGANDLLARPNQEVAIRDAKASLQAVYQRAKQENPNIKVIAFTVSPWGDYTFYKSEHDASLQALNSWIRTTASSLHDGHVDAFDLLKDPGNPTKLQSSFKGDGIHFTGAGHTILANALIQKL